MLSSSTIELVPVQAIYRRQWTAEGAVFGAISLCFLFVYEIYRDSGTAERIYAKFTRKTCLVPRSDEFEGHG